LDEILKKHVLHISIVKESEVNIGSFI